MKSIFAPIISFSLVLMLCSCGYRFQSRIIKLEGVENFLEISVKNETYEPEIELIVKNDLTTVFSGNNWLTGESGKDGAIFFCKVVSFENKPVSHTADDSISQYEAAITFDVIIYKMDTPDNIIFSAKKRRYAEQYVADNDVKITASNKRAAIIRISDKFSHDIEDSISQGF